VTVIPGPMRPAGWLFWSTTAAMMRTTPSFGSLGSGSMRLIVVVANPVASRVTYRISNPSIELKPSGGKVGAVESSGKTSPAPISTPTRAFGAPRNSSV
jgi:hypothetical protein